VIWYAAGVYAIFARDEVGARTHLVGRSHTIDTSFGTLGYAVMGEGEPVLTIHGGGGGFARAMLGSDFISWAALKLMPDTMTQMPLGTDPAVLCAAEPSEQARVQQILHHILPVSVHFEGMLFDTRTAAAPMPYPLERITCPVLTISAEDNWFGTADPARYIATNGPDGRAVIYSTGVHVMVGDYADVLRQITSVFGGR
jgi:pimeloyl-ACP methyl ester carboxylesterase